MMRRLGVRFLGAIVSFTCAVLSLSAPTAVAQTTDWRKIPRPPLRQFTMQQPKRIDLPNGMIVFLQEDRELPLISGSAVIRGGSREEPPAKAGLVSIYGEVWRTGGTKSRTGDQLDDFLEARAAAVEAGGDIDSTGISFNCLKQDFDAVFGIFQELLKEPAFREDKISLAKTQVSTGIARRNDDAGSIADREAARLVYGSDSPYGRLVEYYTLSAVTQKDLMEWHASTVHPNNIIFGITGDFDSLSMEAKLRKAFSSWPRGPQMPQPKIPDPQPRPGVFFIAKDDVNQSYIRLVHPGIRRDDPSYYAVQILNEILGGGFSSRLFSHIRTAKGLAYDVGGGIGSGFDYPGAFTLSMGTKSETTGAAIDALKEEIDSILKSPVSDAELQRAKDGILNSFVFRFDTREEVLKEQMALAFYGYPSDFTARYRTGVDKVTVEDVSRAAKTHIHPDRLALLVVGRSGGLDRPLTSFGQVTNIDITIPDSAPGSAPATPAPSAKDAERGRSLIRKAVEAHGGKQRLAAVKSVRLKADVEMNTPQGAMKIGLNTTVVFPDRISQEMTTPMGVMTMIASPGGAFVQSPMGSQDLPASQKEELLQDARTMHIHILQQADNQSFTFSPISREKIGAVSAEVVQISGEGISVRWFLDPGGRLLRSVEKGSAGEEITDYPEWFTVEGILVPKQMRVTANGQPMGSAVVTAFEINPQVAPNAFEKPKQ